MVTARPGFSIDLARAEPSTLVLAVSGEIDMASAPEFEEALAEAIGASAKGLVVDLTHVSFMDSTGLNALVRAFERHRWADRGFAVVSDDRRVTIMLEISRLDRVITRYRTRAEAVAAMAERL